MWYFFSFLLWLSAFHTYNSFYSTSPNFWKSRIDVWWFVLISFPHFLLPYLVIFWPFNFSLFDLADSFYFETLGGVVECESPNPTDRGFVLHIGNCCGLERKRVSSSRTVPIVYGPPNLQSNETLPSYSSLLLPAQFTLPSPRPLPSISECPHIVLWEGNFYSSIPNYVPVEGGTPYSILPVVRRGPRSPCLISDWRLYSYHPDVFNIDMYFSRLGCNLQGHSSFLPF